MSRTAWIFAFGALLTLPAAAQQWGSGYNMGSIGVTGGVEGQGTIVLDCAEAGNAVVPQGALSIFLHPAAEAPAGAGDFVFSVDGSEVTLPFTENQGDGFVYDKTPETLAAVTALIDLLKAGDELVVNGEEGEIARLGLSGAAAALDGVEVCLV